MQSLELRYSSLEKSMSIINIVKIILISMIATFGMSRAMSFNKPNKILSLCNGTLDHPCIVQDTNQNSPFAIAKHFRDANMLAQDDKNNVTGLNHLWASASGTPNVAQLNLIAKYIRKATKGQVKKIIDLDLRQETHGLLNNEAITLTSQHDWINLGKTYQEIIQLEQQWLQTLAHQTIIKNILTPKQFKSGHFSSGVDVRVESVRSEQEIAEQAGFDYQRLTITDHMAPTDEEVDRFLFLVNNITADTWLHMHCRGGDGRSTTFFAMYDMLRNANQASFDDIIKRQASVEPYYNLAATSRKDPTLAPYYKARYAFMKQFYQFARDRLHGYKGSWSQWKNVSSH